MLDASLKNLAALCSNPARGACAGCDSRHGCEAELDKLVSSMLSQAYYLTDATIEEVRRTVSAIDADTGNQIRSNRWVRFMEQVASIAMDCGRVRPIDTIDSAICCLKEFNS